MTHDPFFGSEWNNVGYARQRLQYISSSKYWLIPKWSDQVCRYWKHKLCVWQKSKTTDVDEELAND